MVNRFTLFFILDKRGYIANRSQHSSNPISYVAAYGQKRNRHSKSKVKGAYASILTNYPFPTSRIK